MQLDQLLKEAIGKPTNPEPAKEPEAVNPEPAKEPEQPANPEPAKEPEATNPENPKEPEPAKDPEPAKEPAKSNPMKELRDKYNQTQKDKDFISNTLEKFYNGDYKLNPKDFKTEDGKLDYQALAKAMEDADNEALAKNKGITPELQAEITRIEKEKIELKKKELKVSMERNIANMQVDLNLNATQINQFFKDAMDVKKNPYQWLAQGGSLTDLYNLIYHDRILKESIDKAVAEAKAKWEADRSATPPTPNPATPSNNDTTKGLSLADLIKEAGQK